MNQVLLKGVVASAFLAAAITSAVAQTSTMSALLAQGFEVKAMTSAAIPLPNAPQGSEAIFVILQKEGEAYGCVLQSATSSFCQRIE